MQKIYESKNPGLTVILPPEQQAIVEEHNNGRPLKFPAKDPRFVTGSRELQEVIEKSAHFEKGIIVHIPSPEEISAAKRERDRRNVQAVLEKLPGVKVSDKQIEEALDSIDKDESQEEKQEKLNAAKDDAVAAARRKALEKARAAKAAKAKATK